MRVELEEVYRQHNSSTRYSVITFLCKISRHRVKYRENVSVLEIRIESFIYSSNLFHLNFYLFIHYFKEMDKRV